MSVEALFRYPVKGLSPERLEAATLEAGAFFPGDRLFAVENGRSQFDPAAPSFQPKTRFLMLMKNAGLAQLTTRYDDASSILAIARGDQVLARGDLRIPEGRALVEACLEQHCAGELRGPVRLLSASPGFRFTDSIRSGFVSVLNLASVRDLERHAGQEIDPLRFRSNVHVEGWAPWVEEGLVGRRLSIGSVRVKVLKTIERCAATHVDPTTGRRDLDVVDILRRTYGRQTCGIYVSVLEAGTILPGDEVGYADLL
jgi:uncharacterized protein YcbX